MTPKKTVVRGEKIVYEEVTKQEVCNGCIWNPIGGSCLVYKYRNPEACVKMRELLENTPDHFQTNLPFEEITVGKIVSLWDFKTGKKEFSYYKAKARIDWNGCWIVWTKQISKTKYERFQAKKRREARAKAKTSRTLLDFVPPTNPWINN